MRHTILKRVSAFYESNPCTPIWVVLYTFHNTFALIISAEVDEAVEAFVATTLVPDSDPPCVVSATCFAQAFSQGLKRLSIPQIIPIHGYTVPLTR